MKNRVETFGCRLNAFESKIIEANLPAEKDSARVVFNSCAVTSEAVRQVKTIYKENGGNIQMSR